MTSQNISEQRVLSADQVIPLMQALSAWGNTTTIIIHGGSVFEFKGPFPKGQLANGFYNFEGPVPGFHGHIAVDKIAYVGFQDKQHRGKASHAFVFNDHEGDAIFKVFLGRDGQGALIAPQVEAYHRIQSILAI